MRTHCVPARSQAANLLSRGRKKYADPSRRMSRNSELASRNRGLLDPVVAGRVLDGGSGPRPEITNQTTSANTTIAVSIKWSFAKTQ
ncbi:MAG: hypothetical protein Ct9H300mP12_16650 [Acidimicrobiales bacterium]|nr:MAG: hypothetical protein Ct9H300mP12_16650 [Acidimicrobiales bacterium]